MGGHVLQHVRGRLKGLLTNLVQADRVPALFAGHGSARNSSDGYVHVTSIPFSPVQCRRVQSASGQRLMTIARSWTIIREPGCFTRFRL